MTQNIWSEIVWDYKSNDRWKDASAPLYFTACRNYKTKALFYELTG